MTEPTIERTECGWILSDSDGCRVWKLVGSGYTPEVGVFAREGVPATHKFLLSAMLPLTPGEFCRHCWSVYCKE